ncbi:hypothetical protein VP01_9160g1 [Puccinia sorghi]|uniref:Retrovirus-related Pol polyprotein from transposon TNT 1-94 n=1 Tax=Puccinia sorghi TaxID=27349 RepID=A0A0L6U9K2_9BASI|nr:hypothetical protein VP01_9160g1 [Puccinia sorghi]
MINYGLAIGLLNHIAELTRPDISFAISSLAQYSFKPGMTHWHEVKKVWQYLKGTINLKLTLQIKKPNQLLQIFSEASWGQSQGSKFSIWLFMFSVWNSRFMEQLEKANIQMSTAYHLIDDPDLKEVLMMSNDKFTEKFSNEHLIDNKGLNDKVKRFGSNPKTRHIDPKTKGLRQEVKHEVPRP